MRLWRIQKSTGTKYKHKSQTIYSCKFEEEVNCIFCSLMWRISLFSLTLPKLEVSHNFGMFSLLYKDPVPVPILSLKKRERRSEPFIVFTMNFPDRQSILTVHSFLSVLRPSSNAQKRSKTFMQTAWNGEQLIF